MVLKNRESKLVKKIENQAVTSSLQVAETFEKNHRHVLRGIDNLKKDLPNFGQMFAERNIPDSYGRERRAYYMTKDGFTLLVMGYTGKKAIEFKLAYISQFNEMQEEIANERKPLTAVEQLKLATQGVTELDDRVSKIEDNMPVNRHDIRKVWNFGRSLAVKALGGKESEAYKQIGRKVFQRLWNDFNDHFGLMSYRDLPVSKVDEAAIWLKNSWHLSMKLQDEVEQLNGQEKLF